MAGPSKYKDAVPRLRGYPQASVRERILAFFLDNIGRVATREQIQEAARDPETKKIPENWHQRLSELRTDFGYTILTWRNRGELKIQEYLMPSRRRRRDAGKRVRPTPTTWREVLVRAHSACEWQDCHLREGDIDPVGGGTVRLTPDHMKPHALNPNADPSDSSCWQALCGRHQVVKKNFWDSATGKLNVVAIVQSVSRSEKLAVYRMLKHFFGDD